MIEKVKDRIHTVLPYIVGIIWYVLIIPLFIIGIGWVFNHQTRYIAPTDDKQHIYKDCPFILRNDSIKEVIELHAYLYLKFSDCDKCVKRKQIEIDKIWEARKQEERDELKEYLQNMIDRLDDGEDADDIASEISEDFRPDEDGDFPTIPLRYQ